MQAIDDAGMVHGFLNFPRFCRSAEPTFHEVADFIQAIANTYSDSGLDTIRQRLLKTLQLIRESAE